MDQVNLGEFNMTVRVRGAYKRYSQSVILRGLNMDVKEGTIYALLGPSGCGKTTLLRCVIGRESLDAGEIHVNVKRRRNLGYMPQELSLFSSMTIQETFNYYGRICEMSLSQIQNRGFDLIKFLALPSDNKLVGDLSGGQQRRISLAVALIHDPQLFILDEPTVGIDPVLSHSIWEKLVEMAEIYKKTIIITTHYIEEARRAHTIGLMRGGVLLAEEAPLDLMYNQNCTTLEEAFLQLSQKQEDAVTETESSEAPFQFPTPQVAPSRPLQSESIWCTQRFIAQLLKNIAFNIRNIPTICFIFMLPTIQLYLTCSILASEPKNLVLGIISQELPNGFSDCNVYSNLTCSKDGRPLSCKYLDHLRQKQVLLNEFHYEEDGLVSVKEGKTWGLLSFSKNYTTSIYERIDAGKDAVSDVVDWAEIKVSMDMSNLWLSTMLQRDIIFSFVDYLKEVFVECGSYAKLAELPIRFEEPIFGTRETSFYMFAYSGILVSFGFFLPIMFTTGAVLTEKHVGLLDRCLAAGASILEIAAAHSVIQMVIITFQNAIMLALIYIIYNTPQQGSILLILVLLYLVEIAGMCYAFFLAILFESEKLAMYLGTGSNILIFLFSGVTWPVQGMHWILRRIIWLFPVQPAVEAYRGISERSWGLDNRTVYFGFISTCVWIFVFAISAVIVARKKKIGL